MDRPSTLDLLSLDLIVNKSQMHINARNNSSDLHVRIRSLHNLLISRYSWPEALNFIQFFTLFNSGLSAGVGTGYGNNLLSGGFSAGLGSGYPAKPGHSYYYSPTYPYSQQKIKLEKEKSRE